MPETRVLLALCLVIVIVVGVNAMLLGALRGARREGNAWELLRKAGRTARHPWGREDAQLNELSRLVAGLKRTPEVDDEEQAG